MRRVQTVRASTSLRALLSDDGCYGCLPRGGRSSPSSCCIDVRAFPRPSRLKLKCDKKIPCGSCVRRGCTSICPNGASPACACGTVWIPVLRTRCSHALCGGGRPVCSQGAYLQDKAQGVYICCVIASHLSLPARVRLRPCFPSIGMTRRPSVDASCLLEICG